MKLKHLFLLSFLFVMGMASAQQLGPIPVNPKVRQGKLSNGLTYYILHNEWPEHVANFYIAQRVGSIQENEKQRGLAHFLEHMAFNGSEHYPDSTLLEYTRSLGVGFGDDLNAYTSIDQTVYRVCNVPTKRASALDSCLLILKDWSNGLTLADKEIDKERGVIHQEWQMGSNAQMRILERVLPKLYPGSKYGERLPIGLMSIVDHFPYQDLRDYYKKWYRPDNQCIIVVGDVNVDKIESEIKKLWANVTVPAGAAKVVDEPVADNKEAIYVVDKDKELQNTTIGIAMKHDIFPDANKNDQSYYIDAYAKSLIAMMLNERLSDMVQKGDCPFTGAYAYDGVYLLSKTKAAFQMDVTPKEGKDVEALEAAYREALRVRDFGFTPTEFERSKAEYLSRIESAYLNRNKIKNGQYGDDLRDHFLANEPIPSPEDDYKIMKQIVEMPALNVNVINSYAKELISDKDSNFVVFAWQQEKPGKAYLTEAQLAKAINNVRGEKLTAYVDNVKSEPLLDETKLPKAGKIVKTVENKELGYKELTLSNGAKVILKKTDYKENEIQFSGNSKGGQSLYGPADYTNLKYFDAFINEGGLGNFKKTELQKALAGKQVSVVLSLDESEQNISGSTVLKDIETMMQLVYLRFTDVKIDKDAYDALKTQLQQQLQNKSLVPESVFSDSAMVTLFGHNPRFAPMDVKDLAQISYDRILQIWKERYASPGQFTFYFVGNYDENALRPLIEKYLACLPQGKAETYKPFSTLVDGTVINHFTHKSETPKAMAVEVWKAPVQNNLENTIMINAIGQVLTMYYLKDIREDASAAYSVGASGALESTFDKPEWHLQAYCPMDPNKSDVAVKLLNGDIQKTAQNIDADKVQKVKDNMLKNYDISVKTNGYWMGRLYTYVEKGINLDADYKQYVNALTPAKISAAIKKILDTKNHVEVVMTPAK